MSEFEKEIPIPMSERVKISDLKFDQANPNRMSLAQLERLKASIKKWGDIVPVVTNSELLVADGQQRVTAMKELGMTECSVIRLPVEEVDRRLLRQVLNKLRGEHDRELDAEEFRAIMDLGREDDLKYLLSLSDDKLEGYFHPEESVSYQETYEIIIECEDERQQEAIYNKLIGEGYRCRVSTL